MEFKSWNKNKIENLIYFQMQGIGIKTTDQGILPASKDVGR